MQTYDCVHRTLFEIVEHNFLEPDSVQTQKSIKPDRHVSIICGDVVVCLRAVVSFHPVLDVVWIFRIVERNCARQPGQLLLHRCWHIPCNELHLRCRHILLKMRCRQGHGGIRSYAGCMRTCNRIVQCRSLNGRLDILHRLVLLQRRLDILQIKIRKLSNYIIDSELYCEGANCWTDLPSWHEWHHRHLLTWVERKDIDRTREEEKAGKQTDLRR